MGEEQEVDLTGYSMKFEKCQFVKQYDEEEDGGEDNDTILSTKRFVIFRMCPDSSCSSCNYNYGEYIVDMEAVSRLASSLMRSVPSMTPPRTLRATCKMMMATT